MLTSGKAAPYFGACAGGRAEHPGGCTAWAANNGRLAPLLIVRQRRVVCPANGDRAACAAYARRNRAVELAVQCTDHRAADLHSLTTPRISAAPATPSTVVALSPPIVPLNASNTTIVFVGATPSYTTAVAFTATNCTVPGWQEP